MRIARLARYKSFSPYQQSRAIPGPDQTAKTISRATWILITLGIFLRLLRYWYSRSLWLDEIFLANNLIHKSALQLLGPLDYRQGAPPLFLLLCKLTITLFGTSEYALRLIPLLAGITSVFLFARLAREILPAITALSALALFSLLEPLIYYSSEVKQYSTDVCVAVAILWAIKNLADATDRSQKKRLLLLSAMGLLGIFLSHPAVLVLTGASIWLVLSKRSRISSLLLVFATWAIALIADYFFFLRPLAANPGLQHHWSSAYPPMSMAVFPWLWNAIKSVFAGYDTMWLRFTVFGIWPAYTAMILAALGCYQLFRRRIMGLVGWPILLTLFAAAAHKYPFDDRLILFLVPMFVLMIGASLEGFGSTIAMFLFAFVLISCVGRQIVFALHPPGREEIKPVMAYLNNNWQAGDTLYIYHPADTAYFYYRDQIGLQNIPFIDGQWHSGDTGAFNHDWQALAGCNRVWILFSHDLPTSGGDEESELMQLLNENHAIKRQEFSAPGAAVYLFVKNSWRLTTPGSSTR